MPVFNTDSVTIVRKKSGIHVRKDITTVPFLPGLGITREEYRANVVRRLYRDPSVILVLEPKEGVCEERIDLPDGYALSVRVVGTDQPFDEKGSPAETASVKLTCSGDVVCSKNYKAEETDYGGQKMLEDMLGYVAEILDRFEAGNYGVSPKKDPDQFRSEPLGFHKICQILGEAGYPMEWIHTVGYVTSPVLLVHENEVVLLGTHHFSGKEPFIEMKRLFFGVNPEALRTALKEAAQKGSPIEVIEWEDGSWSFRATLDDDLVAENLVDRLLSDLGELREFIEEIEEKVGEEPWSIMADQRQLFIYETISESLKLSLLKI